MSPTRDIAKTRVSIARSLRDVEQLALDLHAQALNSPNARDWPGGDALAMLAPAISRQAWLDHYAEVEMQSFVDDEPLAGWNDPLVYQFEDEANEHPLYVLATWSRMWREEFDQPTELKATISREVDYLRKCLDRICEVDEYGEPVHMLAFEMAEELRVLVRRMEDVLREGDRIDTDAAPCFALDAEGDRCGGTLARVNLRPRQCIHTLMGPAALAANPAASLQHRECDQGGRDDLYRCLSCEKIYTPAEYWLAVREHMEREAG